jgi:ABC-type Mn2+/Zn2+ transport system ATPase subunit
VTVRELVAAGRVAVGGLLGPLRSRDRRLVDEAIARVGLTDEADTPVRRLSGGQQQRASIAKALACEPELLVLDEPTTGVDAEAQEALAALLDRLHRELAVTVLYVSHEFGAVERFVERLVLVRGGIVFDGPPGNLPAVWHDPSHVHA